MQRFQLNIYAEDISLNQHCMYDKFFVEGNLERLSFENKLGVGGQTDGMTLYLVLHGVEVESSVDHHLTNALINREPIVDVRPGDLLVPGHRLT